MLNRGALLRRLVDQFDFSTETDGPAERRQVSGAVFVRSHEVRRFALARAGGTCEFCALPGFSTSDGGVFLETHHVIPLGEGGSDTVTIVAALRPNHHREAHHGAIRAKIREALLAKLCQPR